MYCNPIKQKLLISIMYTQHENLWLVVLLSLLGGLGLVLTSLTITTICNPVYKSCVTAFKLPTHYAANIKRQLQR